MKQEIWRSRKSPEDGESLR